MEIKAALDNLKSFDESRPSAPGEHWIALGAGVALLLFAAGRRSPIARTLMRTAATGLIARALSGRDGIQRMFR